MINDDYFKAVFLNYVSLEKPEKYTVLTRRVLVEKSNSKKLVILVGSMKILLIIS